MGLPKGSYENEDLRPPTKTKTHYENEDLSPPYENEIPWENEDTLLKQVQKRLILPLWTKIMFIKKSWILNLARL